MRESTEEIGVTPVDLIEIWPDLKRVLRVQIKEFIHSVEDVEFAVQASVTPVPSTRNVVNNPPSSQSNVA